MNNWGNEKVLRGSNARRPMHSVSPCWWNMGLSRTVSEINGDFSRKSHFSTHFVFNASLREFPLEFCNGGSAQKLVMPIPNGGESLTICAFVSIQYQTVLDRQTDMQICLNNIALYVHRHADARLKRKDPLNIVKIQLLNVIAILRINLAGPWIPSACPLLPTGSIGYNEEQRIKAKAFVVRGTKWST